MPHSYRFERLERPDVPSPISQRLRTVVWREWCFARAVGSQLGVRLLLLAGLLVVGALMFQVFEPERGLSFVQAVYFTFSLLFAQPPESFPQSRLPRNLRGSHARIARTHAGRHDA